MSPTKFSRSPRSWVSPLCCWAQAGCFFSSEAAAGKRPWPVSLVFDRSETSIDVIADIQAGILHRRIVAELVDSRADALLHAFADRPVLPVHQIPKLHCVHWVKVLLCHLLWIKKKIAIDSRTIRGQGPKCKGHYMIAGQAKHQVGKAQFAFMADLFCLVERWKR